MIIVAMTGFNAVVRVGEVTDKIKTEKGMGEEDALSALLFTISVD